MHISTAGLEFLQPLVRQFSQAGKQLYLVGGAVRDCLLERATTDLDLTTDALPEQTKQLAAAVRPDSIYTVGERFGTIGLILSGHHIEITTFRAEQYELRSRKPHVTFGDSLNEDLARRDFTINAMAMTLDDGGTIIDPFGGLADLDAGLVRAVGDAAERFREDPLRLLRAVRFATQLGFRLEEGTARTLTHTAASLAEISRERVAQELTHILLADEPDRGIRLLVDLDLMPFIIPEVLDMVAMEQGSYHHKDVFEHTLLVLSRVGPSLPLRWAALLHDIAKPRTISVEHGEVHFLGHESRGEQMARAIMADLRQPHELIEQVALLVRMHLRANQYDAGWTDGAVRRLMREAGEQLPQLFELSRADVTSQRPARVAAALARVNELEEHSRYLAEQEAVASLRSPLDGNELMRLFGRKPGPWIKPVKDYLLGLVLDGTLGGEEKERASQLARQFLAEYEGNGAG